MKKKMTQLNKLVHMYDNTREMEQQFAYDVETMGNQFVKVADQFDLRNPWDQAVYVTILTNMLACVAVNALLDGDNLIPAIEECFEESKKEYLKLAKDQILKGEH